MTSYPSFNHLADLIADKKLFNDLIARQQNIFEINPYKIEKLYSETAKKIYSQILVKYQVTNEFKVLENVWHENQRRVFVWYMVVFFDLLNLNLEKTNLISWQSLCPIFFGKNPYFLEFQFANILKSKSKITWNQEEDRILLEAMAKERPGKWNEVSKRIFYESERKLFKSPKHCRQRWFNHLDESKNKGSWTLQEDYTIFKFIIENGKRWACIVKQMGSRRTEHMIKNRYNSLICRLKKNKKRREEEIAELVFKGLQMEFKSERKQRKLKNQQNLTLPKKSQHLQLQNALEQNVEKNSGTDEEKSQNITSKGQEVKIQQQVKEEVGEEMQIDMGNINNENVFYQGTLFNYYNFGQALMGMQGFAGFYYCPVGALGGMNGGYH